MGSYEDRLFRHDGSFCDTFLSELVEVFFVYFSLSFPLK